MKSLRTFIRRLTAAFAILSISITYTFTAYAVDEQNALAAQAAEKQASPVVDGNPAKYAYTDMVNDIRILTAAYPQYVTADRLAVTEDGRNLLRLVIGNDKAAHHILVNAAIHGREYITAQLVMKQCTEFVRHLANDDAYNGVSYRDMIKDCCIHVVPMINPDGVTISQYGLEGLLHPESVEKVKSIAQKDHAAPEGEYLRRWKANVNGVDLNRNFDGRWADYKDPVGHPSSDHYKGTAPASEIESRAMIKLTRENNYDYIVCYHAQGQVLYWYYGEQGESKTKVTRLMEALRKQNGYAPDAGYNGVDSGGYRDWTAGDLRIPSITVEVGKNYAPVDPAQFPAIWEQNRNAMEEVCLLTK